MTKFKDWVENVSLSQTVSGDWQVRLDGCNVFDDLNQYGVKPRVTFAIKKGFDSKEEARLAAIKWLSDQIDLLEDKKP